MKKIFVFTFLIFIVLPAKAAVLQILHTNDLHSYWQDDEARTGRPGYARVKAQMDYLQALGDAKGWYTIRLDAGDFSEGSLNYLSRHGDASFEIMHDMGYDVVALGNHDYLTGPADLLQKQSNQKTYLPLVAANVDGGEKLGINPGIVLFRGPYRIAVGGATTNEPVYSWTIEPAKITSPFKPVDQWLSMQKADLKIALTHLGLDTDRELALASNDIDLIVGGHSHTVLKAPSVVFNKKNRFIPIVQTGAHGRFVGQLVLNLKGNRQYSFLDYKLHKVTQTKDAQIEAQVQQGLHDLQIQFNEDLSMPISYATKTYQSQYEAVPLIGNLIADAMREATQSDIAYDSGNLYGEMLPQGPVTSYDAYELAPHVYDWSKSGWGMKTCNITGRSLRFIFMLGVLSRTPMYISGAEYTVNGWKVENILVAGKPLVDKKRYKFTLSEGLAKGTNSFYGLDEILCTPWVDSPTLIRNAIRAKIEQTPLITDSVLGPPRIHGLSSQQFKCDECPYPDRNPPY